jgi:hypothetical protein
MADDHGGVTQPAQFLRVEFQPDHEHEEQQPDLTQRTEQSETRRREQRRR